MLNPILDAQALIAKRQDGNTSYYLFDFRGTESPNDFALDAVVATTDFNNKNSQAKVHSGFKLYTEKLAEDAAFKDMIGEILEKQGNSEKQEKVSIISTGHSLGGAAAIIFSAMLRDKGVKEENIQTIVFGAPVPGNKAFLDNYAKEVINVRIDYDPITSSTTSISEEYPKDFGKIIEVNSSVVSDNKWNIFISSTRDLKNKIENLSDTKNNLESRRDKIPVWKWNERSKIDKEIKVVKNKINDNRNKIIKLEAEQFWYAANTIHKEYVTPYTDVFSSGNLVEAAGVGFNFNKIRAEQLANNMNQLNSCISMFNSSQIGSSNCFIGYSPDENLIFNEEQKAKDKLIPSLQRASEYLPAGSNIVQAPVDIVLDWNQKSSNPLDLDSHLVTPQGQHVYFNDRGQLGNPPGTLNAPNAYLYRDSIPDPQVSRGSNGSSQFGVEQTRIDLFQVTQQNGEYRFYVHNYSLYNNTDNGVNQGLEGISKSGAEVRIYQAGDNRLSTTPNDPNQFDSSKIGAQLVGQQYGDPIKAQTGQSGNTWAVFRLDTRTGVISKDNRFGNVSSPADVPKFR